MSWSKIVHVFIYKTVRSGAKCIASVYCYKLLATCKTHAVVVWKPYSSCTIFYRNKHWILPQKEKKTRHFGYPVRMEIPNRTDSVCIYIHTFQPQAIEVISFDMLTVLSLVSVPSLSMCCIYVTTTGRFKNTAIVFCVCIGLRQSLARNIGVLRGAAGIGASINDIMQEGGRG